MSVGGEFGAAAVFLPLVLLSHLFLSTSLYFSTDDALARCLVFSRICAASLKTVLGEAIGQLYRASLALSLWIVPHLWEITSHRYHEEPETSQRSDRTSSRTSGPWLLPCATSHTRRFPKKNSFKYSYLQVAFKVGTRQSYSRVLSLDQAESPRRPWTWFSVSDEDYLERGRCTDGLRGKLDYFLVSEQIKPQTLPNVYLVTAPRFLGYSFNPVSFWYLYDEEQELKYMILEVNNTFDERRMYLLERSETSTEEQGSDKKTAFRQTWPKDFHVSPFNSRKGSYSLVAQDPIWNESLDLLIDNTITLRSSKDHAKLVARLFSTAPAKKVNELDLWDATKFISSWFWVGFVTFPRILKEAANLFFQRKLHVWYRPEVRVLSIGRRATEREEAIERVFRDFVSHQGKAHGFNIDYTSTLAQSNFDIRNAGSNYLGDVQEGTKLQSMHLHVTSPLFYSQYALDPNFIQKAIFQPPEQRTFALDEVDPNLISKVFSWSPTTESKLVEPLSLPLAFRLLRKASRSQHPMDHFTMQRCSKPSASDESKSRGDKEAKQKYIQAVQGLLISNWLSFGVPELLDAGGWLVRLYLLWWATDCWTEWPEALANFSWAAMASLAWMIGFFYAFWAS